MNYSILCYILAVVVFFSGLLSVFIYFVRRRSSNIVANKQYFRFAILFSLFLSVALFGFTSRNETDVTPFFAAFSLIGLLSITSWLNEIIIFDDNSFTRRNFFGIRKRFSYDMVTKTKTVTNRYKTGNVPIFYNETKTYIYIGKRRFSILNNSFNFNSFMQNIPVWENNSDNED